METLSIESTVQGCVLARIWLYEMYQDTGITMQCIAMYCDTVSEVIYSYF